MQTTIRKNYGVSGPAMGGCGTTDVRPELLRGSVGNGGAEAWPICRRASCCMGEPARIHETATCDGKRPVNIGIVTVLFDRTAAKADHARNKNRVAPQESGELKWLKFCLSKHCPMSRRAAVCSMSMSRDVIWLLRPTCFLPACSSHSAPMQNGPEGNVRSSGMRRRQGIRRPSPVLPIFGEPFGKCLISGRNCLPQFQQADCRRQTGAVRRFLSNTRAVWHMRGHVR